MDICYICEGDALYGSVLKDYKKAKAVCSKCASLIVEMKQKTNWDKKGREIEIAQSINLAQNHVLKLVGKLSLEGTIKFSDTEIIAGIKTLYPAYLDLLIQSKNNLQNND